MDSVELKVEVFGIFFGILWNLCRIVCNLCGFCGIDIQLCVILGGAICVEFELEAFGTQKKV